MKFRLAIALLLIPSLLTGCNKQNQEEITGDKVTVHLGTMINTASSGYNVEYIYNDNFFEKSATEFNKGLMMLSFGANISSRKVDLVTKFYKDIGFENIYTNEDYSKEMTEDTIGYIFSHKKMEEYEVVAVTIRSYDYEREWANNFEVGENGNHVGFEKSSSKVFTSLKTYLDQYKDVQNLKLWVNGYSRGGAVANVLSSKLMTSQDLKVTKDNLYAYTFATPRALSKENAVAYENVFNMVNSADIIARLLPEQYGLYRCGIDKELYNEKIDEYLTELDKDIVIEKFEAKDESYKNEVEYVDYTMNLLMKYEKNEEYDEQHPFMLFDRAHFYEIQDYLRFAFNTIMSIPNYSTVLANKIGKMSKIELLGLLGDDGTKLYNLIKGILDENRMTCDWDYLLTTCQNFTNLVQRYLGSFYSLAASNNGKRIIKFHMPESIYVLTKNYN